LALGVVVAVLAMLGYIQYARSVPADSPLARMYRTEADLTSLVKAVETYHALYGVYPPGGRDGLQKACAALSRRANYLPDGPPPDGWNRPFRYVPSTEYDFPGSPTVRQDGQPYAPGAYQIYSMGSTAGPDSNAPDTRRGFITSWDKEKTWRPSYNELQKQYLLERKVR